MIFQSIKYRQELRRALIYMFVDKKARTVQMFTVQFKVVSSDSQLVECFVPLFSSVKVGVL